MPSAIADSPYMDLVAQFQLRPIRTKTQMTAALKMLDRLAVQSPASLDAGTRDYLEVLSNLIEAYDSEHRPMPTLRGTQTQRLNALMEFSQSTPADLQSILQLSQSAVSLLLSGKRALTTASIAKLCKRFKLSSDLFI